MDLYSLGLLDTLRAYREGRATVQDYVASCSQRITALEPRIQAWEWFDASRAMAEAEERAGGILGDLPLFGITVRSKNRQGSYKPAGSNNQYATVHVLRYCPNL